MTREGPGPQHPQADPTVVTRVLDGEAVLFDPRSGSVIHLNPSGTAVWMLLDGTQPLAGVVEELAGVFDVPVEKILPEVEAALVDLGDRGFLLRDGPPEGEPPPSALAGLSVVPRPPDPGRASDPFTEWVGQLNLRAGDFVIGVEYDAEPTAQALRAAAGELLTDAAGLQDVAEIPAAYGVRTAVVEFRRRRVGLVHHGADVRYRLGSLDEAVRTIVQVVRDLSARRPDDLVVPFDVYARDDSAVMVDTRSMVELDHQRLGRARISEVPCLAPTIDPRTSQVTAGGRSYRLVGIVEPWIVGGAALDEVRCTVTSRVNGDQRAFAMVVDALGERVTAATADPGPRDVTSAVIELLA